MSTNASKPHHRAGIRAFNKTVLNPAMRLVAGRRHWYAAALHHVGRRTCRPYTIDQPRVDSAAQALPAVRDSRRRVWQRLGIENYLHVHTVAR